MLAGTTATFLSMAATRREATANAFVAFRSAMMDFAGLALSLVMAAPRGSWLKRAAGW